MFMDSVCIPAAVQLVLDDVGWFYGRDQRWENEPSRTGLARDHVLEDYEVLEEVGAAVGMKINVMFIIGEWDRWNVLAGVPHSNRLGADWKGSPHFNERQAVLIRDFLNSCRHIEMGFHGLLHDFWVDGQNVGGAEFFPPLDHRKNGKAELAPEDDIRRHFDAFFEIYGRWGFTQRIRTFASPGGDRREHVSGRLQPILRDYGIEFWHNNAGEDSRCMVADGLIYNRKAIEICPWEAYDVDPALLPTYPAEKIGILGGHWPNLLRFQPAHNLDRVQEWKAFFLRQSETFGAVLSSDMYFAHHQLLYHDLAVLRETDGGVAVDLAAADACHPLHPYEPVYVSLKNDLPMPSCRGGKLSLWQNKRDFYTVRVDRDPSASEIALDFRR